MKLFRTQSEKLRDTAYSTLVDKLSLRRKVVYQLIKKYGPISGEQIADKMRIRLNEVSGRITELSQLRLIKYAGSTQSTRSKLANSIYKVTIPAEREEIIKVDIIRYRNQIEDLKFDLTGVFSSFGEAVIRKEITRVENLLNNIST